MNNIFEQASRIDLRFPSNKGLLSVSQLWDMPLQAKTNFDLDTVAKAVNAGLKAQAEESFVSTKLNPDKDILVLQLDILKHIIAVKQAEAAERQDAAAKAAQKQRLLAILADKQDESLKSLSMEDIKAELAKLG